MKRVTKHLVSTWMLGTLAILPIAAANAQDCTEADPCQMTLHADIGTDKAHLEYGDTVTLSYDGSDITMLEDVEAWEIEEIDLEPIVIWLPGLTDLENKLVPGYEFEIEVDGETHEGLKLYRDPGSDDWLVVAPDTAHGEIHGGTAHMR